KSVADRWILTRLNETIEKVTDLFERFEFGEAGRQLYNFIWDDFCDWYIEMSKETLYGDNEAAKQVNKSILVHVLDQILRLLHPIMPFVTEEIWSKLPHTGESLVVAEYPQVAPEWTDEKA
ncbi:valine--tRNA ligase, partial [Enterococcus faecalis]